MLGTRPSQRFLGSRGIDVEIGISKGKAGLAKEIGLVVLNCHLYSCSLGTQVSDIVVGDQLIRTTVEYALCHCGGFIVERRHQQGGHVLGIGQRNQLGTIAGDRNRQVADESIKEVVAENSRREA